MSTSSANDPAWRPLVGAAGALTKDGSGVVVSLDGNRTHQVTVVEAAGGWELSGLVVEAKALSAAGISTTDLWRWNAERCLTAYVVENDGGVWMTALIPSEGLSARSSAGCLPRSPEKPIDSSIGVLGWICIERVDLRYVATRSASCDVLPEFTHQEISQGRRPL